MSLMENCIRNSCNPRAIVNCTMVQKERQIFCENYYVKYLMQKNTNVLLSLLCLMQKLYFV